ncbi:MAG: ABC transporter permease [Oscillospiraceae bacterium]|nr:ABC transporter permease [Oscillospiraceae bacterium]
MAKYIIKRILMLIPVIIGVAFLVFSILSFTPGDPIRIILGEEATPEAIEQLTMELGLDQPLVVQFFRYLVRLAQGDLGRSYITNRPVFGEIMNALPHTIELTIWSVAIGLVIAIPVGVISALKQYSLLDNISMVITLIGAAIPNFWFGLLLMLLFSLTLGLLPSSGVGTPLHMILPALTLGTTNAAIIARMTRSSMLEVIRQDYIRTAKSKGVGRGKIIRKHAFRNASIPIVTVIGLQFGGLLGGAVLTETVFSIPGLGILMVNAIRQMDTPMVLGSIIVFTILFCIINLIVDLLYAFLDPRIKAAYK